MRSLFATCRRGVTLVEVMIATMVLAVGLMGLAALIPVARYEVVEGRRMDQTSALGRAAFRDLLIRGHLQPENWLNPTIENGAKPVLRDRRIHTLPGLLGPPTGPIVIDPLMVFPAGFGWKDGFHGGVEERGESELSNHLQRVRTFPYLIPGGAENWPEASAPMIPRVTLRQLPGLPWLMHHDVANRTFRSGDDLEVAIRTTDAKRPELVFHQDRRLGTNLPATTPTTHGVSRALTVGPTYAQYRGDYSWFAAVSPTLYELYSPDELQAVLLGDTTYVPATTAATARQYLVTVVICYKRDVGRIDNDAYSLRVRDRPERMVWVDFRGGADARLRVHGITGPGDADRALKVRANQWIAVAGRFDHPLLGGKQTVLLWYRVLASSSTVYQADDDVWYRDVTLQGRNYAENNFALDDANTFDYFKTSAPREFPTGYGIIIEGAVAVYEKTMTLDGSSLWSTVTP
jgi:prepilin-type N-terminal cleavage/methylation domain-containing protein